MTRARWLMLAAVVIVAAAIVIPLAWPRSAGTGTPSALTLDRLGTTALTIAEFDGDPNPSRVRAVQHGDWIIELQGHFRCRQCGRSGGADDPVGDALRLRLDSKSFTTRGVTLEKDSAPLSALGHVIALPNVWDHPAALYPAVRRAADPGTSFAANAVYAALDKVATGSGYAWIVTATGHFGGATRLSLVFRARQGALIDDAPVVTTHRAIDLAKLGHVVVLHG